MIFINQTSLIRQSGKIFPMKKSKTRVIFTNFVRLFLEFILIFSHTQME